jgi:hypothetical protein
MKDKKVDKAFKEGLQGGKMPYSDSYWAQMESLIPASAPATAPVPAAKVLGAQGLRLATWVLGIAMAGTAGYFWLSDTEAKPGSQNPSNNKQQPIEQVETTIKSTAVEKTAQSETENNEANALTATETQNPAAKTAKPIVAEKLVPTAATLNTNEVKVSTTSAGTSKGEANVSATTVNYGPETNVNALPDAPKIAGSEEAASNANWADEATGKGVAESSSVNQSSEQQNEIVSSETGESAEMADHKAELPMASSPDEAASPIILPHQKGKKFLWSAGVDYQYLLLNRSLTSNNAGLTDYVDFRNTYENPTYQSGVGLNVQLEMNKWLFNSGVYSVTFHEEIVYPGSLMVNVGIDNSQWQTQDIWSYTVDSTWVIDSIFVGHWRPDTAWTLTVDSLWQEHWDTVATEKEAPELLANNGILSLNYVELPLWFGRSFGKNQWHFDVQGGLGVGILTGTKGSVYINQRLDGLVSTSYQVEQFSQLNVSGMLRAGIRYEFTEQLQVLFYPTLRYTFTSVFSDAAIRQRYLGYGATVGVVYRF